MTNIEYIRALNDDEACECLYAYINYLISIGKPVSKEEIMGYLHFDGDKSQ